ncbi:hypothetical protein GCM10023144_23540 [Pigmentiphaga soli]|uniref:YrdC-like domain-containing protein n=1 Tax=Pigmentiphaga soli TaxID=1007095 RepID=A0ABP8H175_9BURK
MATTQPYLLLNSGDVAADAQTTFDILRAGGIAVIYLDVAYSILARTEAAVRKIYDTKRRSYSKPTGIVGSLPAHDALHIVSEEGRRVVRAVTVEHDLPLAVVAPFRRDHPFFANMEPFVFNNAIKGDTLNLLLNAGALRNRIGELSWQEQIPMVGSSANVSLTGSRYAVEDIDPALLAIADVVVDYGRSRYENPDRLSSTMIDFRDYSIVRKGVCFDAIEAVFRSEFGIALKEK